MYFFSHVKDALLCFYSDPPWLSLWKKDPVGARETFESIRWLALAYADLKPQCDINLIKLEIKLLQIIAIIGQNPLSKE